MDLKDYLWTILTVQTSVESEVKEVLIKVLINKMLPVKGGQKKIFTGFVEDEVSEF